ncbi:TPR repeat-containing protein [Chitinophaga pinensis DSM 2588]|uniref:TPR repeat-containing protein n=2 Tax=Chitinophaga pinensis TaxID=79329 RepID=A0A979GBW5_CHIPD|nr:TPR repeat-containing protein [Chitinophaga pinensis DSM 2588]
MNMKRFSTFLLLSTAFSVPTIAQNYKQDFEKLSTSGDTTKQRVLLAKWEKAKPNDAELYIAYFNYYVSKSKTEVVTINHTANGSNALKAGKNGDPAGYTSEVGYKKEPLNKGFKYINTGISKFPNRLDMRFGKIYMLGENYNYTNLTKELVSAINYGSTIDNKWKWSDNKALEKPEQFMLNAVQEYVAQIYNVGKSQADNIKLISETVLKYYPKHVESLSDLGLAYTLKEDTENALKTFLKANAIAPKDYIVLNNIANIYAKKGDDEHAVMYYEQTLKYGDQEAKDLASAEIKRINSKKPVPKATMPKPATAKTSAEKATNSKPTTAKTVSKTKTDTDKSNSSKSTAAKNTKKPTSKMPSKN